MTIPANVQAIIDDLAPACSDAWSPGVQDRRRELMTRFYRRLAASSPAVDREHVVVPRAVIETIVKECDQGDPRTTGARIGGAVIALRRLLSAIPSKETEA